MAVMDNFLIKTALVFADNTDQLYHPAEFVKIICFGNFYILSLAISEYALYDNNNKL